MTPPPPVPLRCVPPGKYYCFSLHVHSTLVLSNCSGMSHTVFFGGDSFAKEYDGDKDLSGALVAELQVTSIAMGSTTTTGQRAAPPLPLLLLLSLLLRLLLLLILLRMGSRVVHRCLPGSLAVVPVSPNVCINSISCPWTAECKKRAGRRQRLPATDAAACHAEDLRVCSDRDVGLGGASTKHSHRIVTPAPLIHGLPLSRSISRQLRWSCLLRH